jgi:hypothetical protein
VPASNIVAGQMKKAPRVIFLTKHTSETDWLIEASVLGPGVRVISGLISKAYVDDWINGERKLKWLRSEGYAK